MQFVSLADNLCSSSRLIYGCMRIADGDGFDDGFAAIDAALAAGYNHFDHADIYGNGASEALFGRYLRDNPGVREQILITSKCGIRFAGDPAAASPKRYDFSADHITQSVDASLDRLGIEYMDLLLLHRPDFLFDADEVAQVLELLQQQGKVSHLGVSNFSPSQLTLLQSRLNTPLLVNQVELNIHNIDALTDGTLDQCQQLRVTPQAWSPLVGVVHSGFGDGVPANIQAHIDDEIGRQSREFDAEPWIVMLAWLLRHPAGIMPIVGSTNPQRIHAATRALEIQYDRESWYRLLEARLGAPLP